MAERKPAIKLPEGAKPSVAPAAVRTFAQRLGLSETDALLKMEELLGGPVEVIEPSEPFLVVVTRAKILPTSRKVTCSICEIECWAAEQYGPLATYLCMECAEKAE